MGEATPRLEGKAAEFARVLRTHLPELKDRYGVKTLGIFGSHVRGEEREDSDLDVLVEFNRSIGLFGFVRLELYLSVLLGVQVDLVTTRALKRRIGKRILQEVVEV